MSEFKGSRSNHVLAWLMLLLSVKDYAWL